MNLGWVFLCFCIGFLYLLTLGCFFGVVEDRPFLFERRSLFFPVTFVDFESFFGTIFRVLICGNRGPGPQGSGANDRFFQSNPGNPGRPPQEILSLCTASGVRLFQKLCRDVLQKRKKMARCCLGDFFFFLMVEIRHVMFVAPSCVD